MRRDRLFVRLKGSKTHYSLALQRFLLGLK
jgi:hypothetical protein